MDARQFFENVLPQEGVGWYVGFATKKNPDDPGELYKKIDSFRTLDKLIRFLTYWDRSGYDCYYACGAFEVARYYDEKIREWQRKGKNNKPLLRDFSGDVDAKTSHPKAHYDHREDAALALVRFADAYKLPYPLWVSSGGGVQFHWWFDVAIPMADWLPLALGLKAALLSFGVHVDPAPTGNPCAVLRPPGFHHTKTGNIVQADGDGHVSLAQFEQFRSLSNVVSHRAKYAQEPAGPVARAVLGELWNEPSDPDLIGQRCQQFAAFIAGYRDCPEPLHHSIAGVCKNCGDEGKWYLDHLDAEWRDRGQGKLDRWTAGPTSCEHFESVNPEGCRGCVYKGCIAGPIQLGRHDFALDATVGETQNEPHARSAAAPDTGKLNGFRYLEGTSWTADEKDRLVWRKENKAGKPDDTIVCDQLIYIKSVHENESSRRASLTFGFLKKAEGWQEFNIDRAVYDGTQGLTELASRGITVRNSEFFRSYIKDQIFDYEHDQGQAAMVRYDQAGWKPDWSFLGPGGMLLRSDGTYAQAVLSDSLAIRVKNGFMAMPGGSAAGWVSITNRLHQPDDYPSWYAICSSAGSIGTPFFNDVEGGPIVYAVGRSGSVKSTTMVSAATIWGTWESMRFNFYDTVSSIGLTASELGIGPPLFSDEFHRILTNDPQFGMQRLRAIIDMLMQGSDKHRAQAGGKGLQQQLLRHCRTTILAGNLSMLDNIEAHCAPIDGQAAGMRILEVPFEVREFDNPSEGDRLKMELNKNAGHVAIAILKHIMQPGRIEVLKLELYRVAENLWRTAKVATAQRFRINNLACAYVFGKIMKELNLLPPALDLEEMVKFIIRQIKPTSDPIDLQVGDMSSNAVNKFLTANVRNTLTVQDAFKSGAIQTALSRPQELIVRNELATRRAYAPAKEFRLFLVKGGCPLKETIEYLQKIGVIVSMNKLMTLGAGTEYASGQVRCVIFDRSKLEREEEPSVIYPAQGSMLDQRVSPGQFVQ
jgi:hypothetical protein